MVTSQHEASHRIFQERPELITSVFAIFDVRTPDKADVEILSPDATEIRPLERRVDTVLRIRPNGDERGFLLAIEAQGRRDEGKPSSWSYYLSYLRAKYDCPALLLVVCQDKATAEWAAGPFLNGWGGWTASWVRPMAVGPDNVPLITDPEVASGNLALAAFAAMTHARDRAAPAILEALAQALGASDPATTAYYSEILEIGLGASPARDVWRKLMKVNGSYFPGRGTLIEETFLEGKAEGMAEGRSEGLAGAVLRMLQHREILVADETRNRIVECHDVERLEQWVDRAFTVRTAEELFEDGADETGAAQAPDEAGSRAG